MAKVKWTESDIKKKQAAGTLPAVQISLLDVHMDVVANDHKADGEYIHLVELMQQGYAFFFPLNVPSLKNSQEIQQMFTGKSNCCNAPYIKLGNRKYQCTACNSSCQLGTRPLLRKSKRAQEYMDLMIPMVDAKKSQLKKIVSEIGYPVHMGLYFIRESQHDFDFDNAITMIMDCIKGRFIEDDNMNYIYNYPIGYHVDKHNPGVIIAFIKKPIYDYHKIESKVNKFVITNIDI